MSDRLCAGGCGTSIPDGNKSGFAWGHKNGCKTPPPPSNQGTTSTELVVSDRSAEIDIPMVEISLREDQVDRIWQGLSLRGKGTAIATVLATHE